MRKTETELKMRLRIQPTSIWKGPDASANIRTSTVVFWSFFGEFFFQIGSPIWSGRRCFRKRSHCSIWWCVWWWRCGSRNPWTANCFADRISRCKRRLKIIRRVAFALIPKAPSCVIKCLRIFKENPMTLPNRRSEVVYRSRQLTFSNERIKIEQSKLSPAETN